MDYSGKVADQYTQYGKEAVTDWVLGYHQVYGLIAPLIGKRVLDYGCGVGKFSRYLKARDAVVTGVDISPDMIERARAYDDGVEYVTLPKSGDLSLVAHKQFDVALLMFVMVNMSSAAEVQTVLTSIYEQLEPGGSIVILGGNWEVANGHRYVSYTFRKYDDLQSGMLVEIDMKTREGEQLVIKETYWSKADYTTQLEAAGFTDVTFHQPTPMDDSYQWLDEKEFPPLLIIKATK